MTDYSTLLDANFSISALPYAAITGPLRLTVRVSKVHERQTLVGSVSQTPYFLPLAIIAHQAQAYVSRLARRMY